MTAQELIELAKSNGRICPQPNRWNDLYQLLPNTRRVGNGWEPALPLILAAWWDTPALSKMMRFEEHIRWADRHDALPRVEAYVLSLREEDWYHFGE